MGVLDYQFKEPLWLEEALTHRSKQAGNNERLEYLGDSILGFLIAEHLYLRFTRATEGELSRSRSSLVKGETLAKLARKLDLGDYLQLGPGELKSGGFRRNSTLADAFEAVVGAVYMDGGMEAVRDFVQNHFQELLNSLSIDESLKDPKTQLQEYLQSRKMQLPLYSILSQEGSVHEQVFEVECFVETLSHRTSGAGSSRRKAEQVAAKQMLEFIHSHK
ncbi:MAG: ribonuclease III [Gammaproteobacteria bacterium]|nr:ribonuclease III [Gammaproteobacteria bacterium]MDH5801036.1 ribonuclease III [Gammaproteobacteria bacterium]